MRELDEYNAINQISSTSPQAWDILYGKRSTKPEAWVQLSRILAHYLPSSYYGQGKW
jgi:hypothetical protein